jgi:predicted dehydrogenase
VANLRAAIVGCGSISSSHHTAAYVADSRVNLVAVVDPDHDRARAMARRFGVREVFSSLDEMLATTDVDFVSICTPPHLHAPLAITALRADCHVLCEQPAATNAADVARMAAVAAAEHRVLTFGFPYRHLTEARTARGLIDTGEIGEIYDVQLTAMRRSGASDRGCHVDRARAGSGPLIDIGVHVLDLAMWLTGFPEAIDTLCVTPDRVLGRGEGVRDGVEGLISRRGGAGTKWTGLVQYRDGMSLTIATSYAAQPADEEIIRVRLLGDKGGLEVFPLLLSHPNPPAPGHTPLVLPGEPWDHELAHRRQTAAFVDACLGRGPVPVTPAEAIHVQDIADRLYRSSHGTAAIAGPAATSTGNPAEPAGPVDPANPAEPAGPAGQANPGHTNLVREATSA